MTFNIRGEVSTIAVMYHYVRDNLAEGTPNLKALDPVDFRRQLDVLEDNLRPLSKGEYFDCIEQNKNFPPRTFILTFDDGLKDHFKYVYPELVRRNLWGFFFVNSAVYTESVPLDVHITHMLLDTLGTGLLWEELRIRFGARLEEVLQTDQALYRYDLDDSARIKRLLNYVLPINEKTHILKDLYHQHIDSLDSAVRELYASPDELRLMAESGMVIGAHSHSHQVLSRLSDSEQRVEIEGSINFLKELDKSSPTVFCYPFGHKQTFNECTKQVLRDNGVHSAFSTTRAEIDLKADCIFELPRFDTVDIR